MNGLYIIPILAFLIIVHELGHFFAARSVGVTVEEFGIGIPPRIKGWRWKGVLWSLNAIPLGGFVRVLGEDGASMEPGSMNTKGPWQRAFFLAAGPAMNLVAAVVLMIFLLGTQGDAVRHVYINYVEPKSPAADAGWQAGDRLISAGGTELDSSEELKSIANDFYDRPMNVVIEREGARVETIVEPRSDPPEGQGATGVQLLGEDPYRASVEVKTVTPGSAAETAGMQPGDKIVSIASTKADDWYAANFALTEAQGRTVPVVVERDGAQVTLDLAVPVTGLLVEDVNADSPAAAAGWQQGDRIVAIGGQPATTVGQLVDAIRAAAGGPVPVTVERGGEGIETQVQLPDTSSATAYSTVLAQLGVNLVGTRLQFAPVGIDFELDYQFDDVPAGEIIPLGFKKSYDTTVLMIDGIKELVTNPDLWGQVAGPIGMGQILNETLDENPTPYWYTIVFFTIVISLNLALLNLLPLPALDGGRLLFVAIELLRGGRRIAPEKEGVVHLVGFVLLLGLMFVIAFSDVDRILDGRSFLP